jgi:hypothetical protein
MGDLSENRQSIPFEEWWEKHSNRVGEKGIPAKDNDNKEFKQPAARFCRRSGAK